MSCPECGCDEPRCADGCRYNWRDRLSWVTSWTFWASLREKARRK